MHRALNFATGQMESVETPEETRRRTEPRKRFATKADWAQDQADSLSRQASELERMPSAGSYARAAKKARHVGNLRREAARYSDMAQRFRKLKQ